MVDTDLLSRLKKFDIPGRVSLMEGNGELTRIEVTTDWSSAEIYLHGAQVTGFQKKGEPPLLFMSQFSRFTSGQPIRGGIPVIFPWFGPREGEATHGFARLVEWELHETTALPEGGVSLRFSLPEVAEGATLPSFTAHYVVTVTDALRLQLIITNASADEPFAFEECLHSYFAVGDISSVQVRGLHGCTYVDKVDGFAKKIETADTVAISSEVDRVYFDTPASLQIEDPDWRRRISLTRHGAASTVLWNPWLTKAQQMHDFGNEEYRSMICVESGNIGPNRVNLPPGRSALLETVLASEKL